MCFYIRRKKDIKEDMDGQVRITKGEYVAVFKFVRIDAVSCDYLEVSSIL